MGAAVCIGEIKRVDDMRIYLDQEGKRMCVNFREDESGEERRGKKKRKTMREGQRFVWGPNEVAAMDRGEGFLVPGCVLVRIGGYIAGILLPIRRPLSNQLSRNARTIRTINVT